MTNQIFQSFLMGGFECSTHRDSRGRRLDLIESTAHDRFALHDYRRMLGHGMYTARDGVRWHLIEREPYTYDFSSLAEQLNAARETGIQIIWDLFHYGFPDDLDIFSEEFPERFSAFSLAVCRHIRSVLPGTLFVCPVNEISFFSWIAGAKGMFHPGKRGRAAELKRSLTSAGVRAAMELKREIADVKVMFTDPAIHVLPPKRATYQSRRAAENYRRSQFEAFDAIEKLDPDAMDIIGLNYYFHNQWRHPSRRKVPRGHPEYRPLREILAEFHQRYKKPLLIAETGIEDDERPSWFKYVCDEVYAARSAGVPVSGICLYPIVNHPGWADDRHCHNGLWDYADDAGGREEYEPLSLEIRRQTSRFQDVSKSMSSAV